LSGVHGAPGERLTSLDVNTGYSPVFDVAAASAGLDAKVVWIVVDGEP
jgi:hypothetical protein